MFNFVNPLALTFLLGILLIILLYLLKPKPKHIKFPSIMFILKIEKTKRFSSFLKKFIRDPLLIVQIIIFSILVLAIANPFFISPSAINPKEDVVIILDGSASMQSTDIKPSRFEKTKELAISIINNLNPESPITLIFAENIPILLLNHGNKDKAIDLIKRIKASDGPSNLQDSILLGIDITSNSKFSKEIYVFSDFSNVGDVKLAKGIALSKNVNVKFVKVIGDKSKGKNLGITSINSKRFIKSKDEFYLTFTVENFNGNDEEAIVEIYLDNNLISSMSKEIPAFSEELFYFKGKCSYDEHILTIKLKNEDNLMLDNFAYWILPEVRKYNILLITNDDIYIENAIESDLDFSLKVAKPPVIPTSDEFDAFDTIVVGNLDKDLILPGMFNDIKEYLKKGNNLVIFSSDYMEEIKKDESFSEILPVVIKGRVDALSRVNVEREHHEIMKNVITENIILNKYIKNTEKNGSLVIAKTKSSPVIAFWEYGKGKVLFVGINPNPDWSNFYLSSSFPIFLSQVIRWINKKEETLETKNFKSGEYISLSTNRVVNLTTPSKKELSSKGFMLDEIGIYSFQSNGIKEKFSVNLQNRDESNIMESLGIETINDKEFNIFHEKTTKKQFLWQHLLITSLIFLLIEAILYKRRGLI